MKDPKASMNAPLAAPACGAAPESTSPSASRLLRAQDLRLDAARALALELSSPEASSVRFEADHLLQRLDDAGVRAATQELVNEQRQDMEGSDPSEPFDLVVAGTRGKRRKGGSWALYSMPYPRAVWAFASDPLAQLDGQVPAEMDLFALTVWTRREDGQWLPVVIACERARRAWAAWVLSAAARWWSILASELGVKAVIQPGGQQPSHDSLEARMLLDSLGATPLLRVGARRRAARAAAAATAAEGTLPVFGAALQGAHAAVPRLRTHAEWERTTR